MRYFNKTIYCCKTAAAIAEHVFWPLFFVFLCAPRLHASVLQDASSRAGVFMYALYEDAGRTALHCS